MKRCPYCAEEIQDAAIKCRFCNSSLTGSALPHDAPRAGAMPPQAAPVQAAQPPAAYPHPGMPGGLQAMQAGMQGMEAPRTLFEGTPSWRASFSRYAMAGGLALVGAAVDVILAVKKEPPVFMLIGGALFGAAVIWILVLNFIVRSKRIRITNQTIDIESGLFGKTITTLQLWRVHDIDYKQSFGERVLGIARIHVLSQDEEEPNLTLSGLPGSRILFDQLKEAIALSRQGRNVVGMVR